MTTLRIRNPMQMALKHEFPPLAIGDTPSHSLDWSRPLGAATIASATWTVLDSNGATSNGITTSAEANASGVSSATVTGVNSGQYLLSCAMTDSAGVIRTARARIRVLDKGDRY